MVALSFEAPAVKLYVLTDHLSPSWSPECTAQEVLPLVSHCVLNRTSTCFLWMCTLVCVCVGVGVGVGVCVGVGVYGWVSVNGQGSR